VPEVVEEESCPPRKWSWSCSVVDEAQEQLEETGRRSGEDSKICKEPSEESKTIRRRRKNSSDVNLQDVLNC